MAATGRAGGPFLYLRAMNRGLAATTWGPGRLDLFWVDDDRALWHSAAIDGAWGEPESLGGQLASGPAVVAWAEGEMEVFEDP